MFYRAHLQGDLTDPIDALAALLPAAAEVDATGGLERLAEGVAVHPGHHENLTGVPLLRDGGDLARFYQSVAQMARLPKAERDARLADLAPESPPPAPVVSRASGP